MDAIRKEVDWFVDGREATSTDGGLVGLALTVDFELRHGSDPHGRRRNLPHLAMMSALWLDQHRMQYRRVPFYSHAEEKLTSRSLLSSHPSPDTELPVYLCILFPLQEKTYDLQHCQTFIAASLGSNLTHHDAHSKPSRRTVQPRPLPHPHAILHRPHNIMWIRHVLYTPQNMLSAL
jgi:hypothetical protein